MTGKMTTRKRSTRPAFRSERHRVRLPMVRMDLEPLSFISRTASTASRAIPLRVTPRSPNTSTIEGGDTRMPDTTGVEDLQQPGALELLRSPDPARLAYTGPDGYPRVIPVRFLWNGTAVV